LVAQYADDNFELLIVLEETANFGQKPDADDCAALQESEEGTVLYDPEGLLQSVYGMDVKMAAGVANGEGHWETSPTGENTYVNAFTALMQLMGFGGARPNF
jgi:hypothetical protein